MATVSLTTGTNNFTGTGGTGNTTSTADTINVTNTNQVQAADTVNGGGGTDTLNITGSVNLTAATADGSAGFLNIEQLTLGATTTATFNANQFGIGKIGTTSDTAPTLTVQGTTGSGQFLVINNASNFSAQNFTYGGNWSSSGSDELWINGTTGNDTLTGSNNSGGDGGYDSISGGDGNDSISGLSDDDTLVGGNGNDSLVGGSGADSMDGGADNDTFTGDTGGDTIVGGTGTDTLDYSAFATNLTVSLPSTTAGTGTINDGGTADSFSSIEVFLLGSGGDTFTGKTGTGSQADSVSGGSGADSLLGGDGNDTLDGGLGNDTINGEGGTADYVSFASAASGITVNLATATGQATGQGTDTIVNIENVLGSGFDDTITGNGSANTIQGGAGADSINGAAGNDSIDGGAGNDTIDGGGNNDTIDGGADTDTLTYAAFGAGVSVSMTSTTTGTVFYPTGGETDTYSNIESLVLTGFADTVTGSSANNTVDTGGGDDSVVGSLGNDTLAGGTGNDTLDYSGLGLSLTLNLATGTVTDGSKTDTISGFETILLGSGSNSVAGSAAGDQITGNDGADTIGGGGGNDTINGGNGGDNIAGQAGDDSINGGNGNDSLWAAGGTDSYDGGADIDTLYYTTFTAPLTVTFTAATSGTVSDGTKTDSFSNVEAFFLGSGNDTFTGNTGAETVTGGKGADSIALGDGDDTFVYRPGDGNDIADGGLGNDTVLLSNPVYLGVQLATLAGWSNFETIDGSPVASGQALLIGTNSADTIDLSDYTLINFAINGMSGNDTITGSDTSDDYITGSIGADVLTGGGGADAFVYLSASHSSALVTDTITDMTDSDIIDLFAVDANTTAVGDQAFSWIGVDTAFSAAGQLRYNSTLDAVQGDVNGDGKVDLQIILSNGYVPDGSEFVL